MLVSGRVWGPTLWGPNVRAKRKRIHVLVEYRLYRLLIRMIIVNVEMFMHIFEQGFKYAEKKSPLRDNHGHCL